MEERLNELLDLAALLKIGLDEDKLDAVLEDLAETVSVEFWNVLNAEGDYDTAHDSAYDAFTSAFIDLPGIKSRKEEDVDIYEEFRELMYLETLERGDIPEDEFDAEERSSEEDFEDEDTY